ncbi:MAG: hypothetical protein K5945_10185, partial [Bacteroidaceae bacterium]|nr:hypothetical protein [Bacteroidaceae bacterium]
LNTCIVDYHLSNSYFSGWFTNADTRFSLRKLVDYYDWGYYNNDYSYGARGSWYDDYPYYAPTRSAAGEGTVPAGGTIVRRGNRFNNEN